MNWFEGQTTCLRCIKGRPYTCTEATNGCNYPIAEDPSAGPLGPSSPGTQRRDGHRRRWRSGSVWGCVVLEMYIIVAYGLRFAPIARTCSLS